MTQSTPSYRTTYLACYLACIVQAVVNNFAPLLFVTFATSYSIPLSQISVLITFNFGTQLLIDFLSAKFVDRIGYRRTIFVAHLCAAAGLAGLAVLPQWMPTPFLGLLLASFLYAVGGGTIEVIVSPTIEACPSPHKSAAMSLLHSFYCWGQLFTILASTLFFHFAGIDRWPILALIWAILPLGNAFFFLFVPLVDPEAEEAHGTPLRSLFREKLFWLFLLLMVCAGAAELSVCQWASAFLEMTVGVSKTWGDLAGPCLFALFMGISRVLYSVLSQKVSLRAYMILSEVLCILSYLMMTLAQQPAIIFAGFALCGFSVGIMWPGTYSMASHRMPRGGTAMFAILALAGDLGCTAGPSLVGVLADSMNGRLDRGLLCAIVFPILLVVGNLFLHHRERGKDGAGDHPSTT